MDFWSLPGLRSFVERVADDGRRYGLVSVITPLHMPAGLDRALRDIMRPSHELLTAIRHADAAPLDVLSSTLGLDLRSARALAKDPRSAGLAVLIADLEPDEIVRWDTTLRAFFSGCENHDRYGITMIVTVTPGEAAKMRACGAPQRSWKGVVTRADATLCALSAIQSPTDPLTDRLAVETAVALCGWDLSGVASEAARRARSRVALFAVPPASDGNAPAPCWENGQCDTFDGVSFVRLDACTARDLRHRIWRAQVAVLFGMLEEMRLKFVHAFAATLASVEDPYNLEWADLARRLRGKAARGVPDFAELCRNLRNKLAHMEPVGWDEIADFNKCARQLKLQA